MAEIGGERGVDLVIRPLRRIRKEEGPPQGKGDHRSGFNGVGGELGGFWCNRGGGGDVVEVAEEWG